MGIPRRAGLFLLVVSTLACKAEGPLDVIPAFLESLEARDPEAPMRYLSSDTRQRLGESATRLRGLSQDAVQRKPHELLSVLSLRMARGRGAIEMRRQEGERAILRVRLEGGGETEVAVVREEGQWRLVLPDAPAKAPAP